MKRILGWLCIVSILVMSMTAGTIVSFAATTSTATVTDVYASGNWTVGQTVTANYTYYDPTGKAQVGDAVIAWYRAGNLKKSNVETLVSSSATYTLTTEDVGSLLYFTVKTANEDGEGRVFYSPVYGGPLAENTSATAPTAQKLHIILTGGARAYTPGVTLRAVHNTSFVNLKAEGETTYMWRVKDTPTGDYTARAYTSTYTITEEDYGKWLECAVTVKDVDEGYGTQQTASVYVGSKLDIDATWATGSNFYQWGDYLVTRLMYRSKDGVYGYKNADMNMVIDAGASVKFDGIFLEASSINSGLTISYSSDNSTWTNLPLGDTVTGNLNTSFPSDNVLKARYFKVAFKSNSSAYGVLWAFFPYLSAANRSAEYVDIKSVGYGAVADNDALSISNIAYGMPANELASSVVAMKDDAVITLTDASGVEVADASSVKLTSANVANYRIKVVHGNASQTYTLAAGALKTIDFSSLPEDTKYTINEIDSVSTGYTRNVPGSEATYWYSDATTAEDYPYAMRETMDDGSYALKIDTNGHPIDSGAVVNLWYGIKDIDAEGCYSFKFKVKPDEDSHVHLGGRPNTNVSGGIFNGGFVQLNTTGLFVHNGTELVRKADFAEDKWYNVEVVVDYKNDKKSVWVDGVNYVDGADFTISNTTYNKSGLMMNITIFVQEGGENDINYIKDLEFNKVWDVHTKLSADGEALGMKLYNGEEVVDTLTAGTYSAKGNGNVFSDEYYVAVYKVTYADSTKSTEVSRNLIKAYHTGGRADAQITDIEVPESAYSDTSEAIVKIFCFNNGLKPARDFILVD